MVIQLLQKERKKNIMKKYEMLLISISLHGNLFLTSYLNRRYAKLLN